MLKKGMKRIRRETIFVISRELRFCPSRLANPRLTALRRAAGLSRPMTVTLIGPARKKKFQRAFSISRVRPLRSRFFTTFHPGEKVSVAITKPGGKGVPCLMSIVPDLLLADIWTFRNVRKQKAVGLPSDEWSAAVRRQPRRQFCERLSSGPRTCPPSE